MRGETYEEWCQRGRAIMQENDDSKFVGVRRGKWGIPLTPDDRRKLREKGREIEERWIKNGCTWSFVKDLRDQQE